MKAVPALLALVLTLPIVGIPVLAKSDTYQAGFAAGYKDGQNHPFNQDIFNGQHSDQYIKGYQNGFEAGCLSVQGNTAQVCEHAMD